MARKTKPVAVAKAPNAIDNDEFSSPVLGSAWLPRLCLRSFTSEVDSEALVEAEVERLAEVLNDVEILVEALVLSEALKNADVLALCDSFNDTDSLVEIEVLTEADCDSLNEILNDADSDTETFDEADSE